MNWTGLHILATAGHNASNEGLVSYVVDAGLPIDGYPSNEGDIYAPEKLYLVAVQHNAFNLAISFFNSGADPNALCSSSGLLSLEYPTTILGHIIAAGAQHAIPHLRYLLEQFLPMHE